MLFRSTILLLKAVIQAIPTYSMSIFLLPKGLCSEINALIQKLWCGHEENEVRIHWMKWSQMGVSKLKRGGGRGAGMGFRDLVSFNKALLAKQVWHLLKDLNSLTAKILRVKYYPRGTIMDTNLGSKPSFAWRSIYRARELIEAGLFW